MPSNVGEASARVTDGSPSDLESHLKNLILSSGTEGTGVGNSSSNLIHSAGTIKAPSNVSGPVPRTGGPSVDESGTSQPSKAGGRKRLNQAQRRQMSSQLSIPIDPRAQSSTQNQAFPVSYGHQSRGSNFNNRHSQPHSNSRFNSQGTRGNGPYGDGFWRNPAPYQPLHTPSQQSMPPGGSYAESGWQQPRRGGPIHHHGFRGPINFGPEEIAAQASLLDRLCFNVVSSSEIERSEIAEKEAFRCKIEDISRQAIFLHEQEKGFPPGFHPLSVELKCFGSLSSGFATKASDMDLGILSPFSLVSPDAPGSPIPRLLEKAYLNAGLGARLLTRTRVPIIKVCENPPEKLLQDLQEERYKWEHGLDQETHAHNDDDEDDENIAIVSGQQQAEKSVVNAEDATSSPTRPTSDQATEEVQTVQLKQGPKSSINSYYGLAKRVLRRAGGRDATISNISVFSDQEWALLDSICKAFVAGLHDTEFRDRLAQFPSLSLQKPTPLPTHRSLIGVFMQVEGELLWKKWQEAGIMERHAGLQATRDQVIGAWYELQNKEDFGTDPIAYTKELQALLEKMKRLPSVQFVSLEQAPHETPSAYHSRTCNIIHGLQPNGGKLQQTAAYQYVAGIHQEDIRNGVQAYVDESRPLRLKAIARRHETLHLAHELQRALDKDLYEEKHVKDIQDYISLLRSPLQKIPGVGEPNFIVPLTSETLELLTRIRGIPDPHKMAPNQPRDRYRDRLEFPKTGTGVQCDINFSAHLALQNTLLLRCYSHTDPRVRPMVLFIKHWAKVRSINSGYRGTLSSYGYVLMVLHYLVNVVQPFVCPNLQHLAPPPPPNPSPAEVEQTICCKGHNIQFWRNEGEIKRLAGANQLNHNTDTIGHLLRGFFEYYAHSGPLTTTGGRGFDWGRDVISLRTLGGLLSKQEKGWTGAKTVVEIQGQSSQQPQPTEPAPVASVSPDTTKNPKDEAQSKQIAQPIKTGEVKEVRHRYLFAIEDPFELKHNVARTVTHNGIVSIRDEFRRAWRIIKSVTSEAVQEDLLQDANDEEEQGSPFANLLDDIHGLRSA